MKITIDRDVFLQQLNIAIRFTSNKLSSLTSLQGVLIKKEKKEMVFVSTNLNMFYKGQIKGNAQGEFTIVVEPKKLSEFLSLLPTGEIELEVKDKKLTVRKEKTQGTFALFETTDFPTPPDLSKEKKQVVKTRFLFKNLPLVLFSASTDDTRPALTSVNFVSSDESLLIVSTDGFRLSLLKTKNDVRIPSMLVPKEFLEEVMREVKGESEVEMIFSKNEKIVLFQTKDKEFYSRLIEGEFPPFEKVVPGESKTKVALDKAEFLQNVKITSVFARDFSNIIICEFTKNALSIKPKTDTDAENTTYQEADLQGEPQKIAFNFRFILDLLNHTEAEKITIEILRPDAPVVFRQSGDREFLHIIMPVRIQES